MRSGSPKILIIRLSSIGDIVLTTPVLRSLRACFPESQIHYLIKAQYQELLEYCPHIDQLHVFRGNLRETIPQLRAEKYDVIIDLHKNLRSHLIRWGLSVKTFSFDKLNWEKFVLTRFKINKLPPVHIVERYAQAILPLGCKLDQEGLEIFIPETLRESAAGDLYNKLSVRPVGVVIGAKYGTKRWPKEYFVDLLNRLERPVLLIGGEEDFKRGKFIAENLEVPCINMIGLASLLESAALLNQCDFIITHDTGMMHIASALGKRIYSLWGNTTPEFGMSPYKTDHSILEVKNLDCRPCSKIGYERCPKGHFRCMMDLSPDQVWSVIREKESKFTA